MRPEAARMVFQVADRVLQNGILPALNDLEKTQWMSPEQLSELSWRRFKALLEFAHSRVPYYRRALDRAGLHPADIRTPRDLERIPVLTKRDVQAAGPDLMPAGELPPSQLDVTSGSTGIPLRFRIDRTARAYFVAAKYRGESWYGVAYGAPIARVWSLPLRPVPRLREQLEDRVLNRVRIDVLDMNEATVERFLARCRGFRPQLIYGYSASTARFAQFVLERGCAGALPSLRAVSTTSETLYDHQRALIGQAFGVPVANEYGCTETGIIAYQCPEGALHITAESVLVEVLRDGRPVPPGETGTLVVTGLHNRSTPFIRYELGDHGALDPRPCPCGRGLPVMAPVIGRTVDALRTRGGTYFPANLFDYIAKSLTERGGGFNGFRVVQTDFDRLRVEIVPTRGYGPHVEQFIAASIARHLGERVQLEFRLVEAIPQERSGKLRYFVSEMAETPETVAAR